MLTENIQKVNEIKKKVQKVYDLLSKTLNSRFINYREFNSLNYKSILVIKKL